MQSSYMPALPTEVPEILYHQGYHLHRRSWTGPEVPITEFGAVSVSSKQCFMQGMLDHIDLNQINTHIQAQHERADFPLAFAGIEIVLNENRRAWSNDDPPFWQAQVHGLVVGLEIDAVERAITREYPSEASNPMPLSLTGCSDLAGTLDSAVKPEFVRNADLKTLASKTHN